MFEVKSMKEVYALIDDNFSGYILESEWVDITEAVGRITAEDIASSEEIPGFNRSSVDGYAVISSDTFGASDSLPAQLRLNGEVKMGKKPVLQLKRGQTVYIPTGGELPENADAVVMIEYSENFGDDDVLINKPVAPGNNVVFKGDDVKHGEIVLKAGTMLRPQDIGLLAALGYSRVQVKRKLKVGIISTGDELVDIYEQPELGEAKVRDINSYALYAALLSYGAEPKRFGIIHDHYGRIRQTVQKAIDECDVVLISGGSSVGNKDETFEVINSLGEPGVLVHGIAVKPGKPTILGRIGKKAVIGLPGHPASAYVIYKTCVIYLLDTVNGRKSIYQPVVKAEMSCNYPSNNGREEFLPVKLEENGGKTVAHPVFGKSGLITFLTSSSGYIHISRGSEGINKGAQVDVTLF